MQCVVEGDMSLRLSSKSRRTSTRMSWDKVITTSPLVISITGKVNPVLAMTVNTANEKMTFKAIPEFELNKKISPTISSTILSLQFQDFRLTSFLANLNGLTESRAS